MVNTAGAIDTLRKFQRHNILRHFDGTGHVPQENLDASRALDILLATHKELHEAAERVLSHTADLHDAINKSAALRW